MTDMEIKTAFWTVIHGLHMFNVISKIYEVCRLHWSDISEINLLDSQVSEGGEQYEAILGRFCASEASKKILEYAKVNPIEVVDTVMEIAEIPVIRGMISVNPDLRKAIGDIKGLLS